MSKCKLHKQILVLKFFNFFLYIFLLSISCLFQTICKTITNHFLLGQTLEATKERFAQLTLAEINEFCDLLAEFVHKFDTEGPGAVGENLDSGVKLLEEYGVIFVELEERRKDLVNAEMLFDIPLADYSDYLRAKSDFDGMELIYKIYKAQRYAREVRK